MTQLLTVRPEDLDWWLNLAPSLKWRFASSMQDVPHDYIVRGKTLAEEDHVRAFGVIRTFGTPGKFYDRTQVYLHDTERDWRWWPMTRHHWQTKILNRAVDGRMYGKQDAPDTSSHVGWSPFDAVGAYYDDLYRETVKSENVSFWKSVSVLTSSKPSVLDLGAGTGGTFDSQAASSRDSVVVDPSQAMLNDLVVKYPNIGRVHAMTAEMYLAMEIGEKFDVVTASFGSASYLEASTIEELPKLSRKGAVLSFYRPGYTSIYHDVTGRPEDTAAFEAATARALRVEEVGNFVNITLKGSGNGN